MSKLIYLLLAYLITIFAAKSIFRFSLREEIDYYLVGTFASLSWAVFWGIILGHFHIFL